MAFYRITEIIAVLQNNNTFHVYKINTVNFEDAKIELLEKIVMDRVLYMIIALRY